MEARFLTGSFAPLAFSREDLGMPLGYRLEETHDFSRALWPIASIVPGALWPQERNRSLLKRNRT